MALVKIQDVSKFFGAGTNMVRALETISIDLRVNEFFTLLGPSGCGKTTLLRLLAGFEHPSTGTILLDGKDLTHEPPNKRPVNTVFQSYALFPHMSVEQNVAFGLERLGRSPAAICERVHTMLRLVHMEDFAGRMPGQLSGGQQQRVALARALAPEPRLLLLDEPLSALDLKLRRSMQAELKRLQRETGITFVLVTHDQEEALSMSDRIAVMKAGRVLQLGTPAEIYERPKTRFVADFIGEANILPGSLFDHPAAFLAVRPERITLHDSKDQQNGRLCGQVRNMTYLGAQTVCDIMLTSGHALKAILPTGPHGITAGSMVTCTIAPAALLPVEE